MKTSFPSATVRAARQYDLDWLRVIAFSILILYHTGMFFVSWGWHVKNNELVEWLERPMEFVAQWRMPLLFLISGAGVSFALGKRTTGQFMGERVKRLFLPLVFGMFFIVPPQIYFERLTQGVAFTSYLDFYPTVLEFQSYPKGNFSWHHLWFLPYILVYSFLALPLCLYLRREGGKQLLQKVAAWVSRPGAIFIFVIPMMVSEMLLRPHWPTDQNLIADWANFTISLLLFLYGFIIASSESIRETIEKYRKVALVVGIVSVTVLFIIYWIPEDEDVWFTALSEKLYYFLKTLNMWSWLLVILGFGRKYLNFSNGLLAYANQAVYPFYILHQTITVTIAYYLINSPLSPGVKFLLISGGTFLIALALYELIIRRIPAIRPLFGLKSLPKSEEKPVLYSMSDQTVNS